MIDYKALALWLESLVDTPQWVMLEALYGEAIESRTGEIINSTSPEHEITYKRGIVAGMKQFLARPHELISHYGSNRTVEEPDTDSTKTGENDV